MELFNTLNALGLTPRVLQIIVIASIVIVLFGLYWRYIVVGAGILFTIVVFAMPSKDTVEVVDKVEQKVEAEVKQVEPPPPVAEVKNQTDEEMFLEDCNLHSGYTSAQCKALWEDNKAEIQKSSWKYKNNNCRQ